MKSKRFKSNEEGYLLLESLLTLIILMAVIAVLGPLTVNWLAKHHGTKNFVEENRQLYENSILLNHEPATQEREDKYTISIDKYRMQINETGTEVVIYESVFKK